MWLLHILQQPISKYSLNLLVGCSSCAAVLFKRTLAGVWKYLPPGSHCVGHCHDSKITLAFQSVNMETCVCPAGTVRRQQVLWSPVPFGVRLVLIGLILVRVNNWTFCCGPCCLCRCGCAYWPGGFCTLCSFCNNLFYCCIKLTSTWIQFFIVDFLHCQWLMLTPLQFYTAEEAS